jgi:hypothetical protein
MLCDVMVLLPLLSVLHAAAALLSELPLSLLLLLQYLDGPEVDCDLVFSQGVCVYGAITDNWPTVEPYFNETGSNCPSILPRK